MVKLHPSSYWLACTLPLLLSTPTSRSIPGTTHFTLKMEAGRSSERLVSYCKTTQHNNPEDLKLESLLPVKTSNLA
jgi:hypothetical protein